MDLKYTKERPTSCLFEPSLSDLSKESSRRIKLGDSLPLYKIENLYNIHLSKTYGSKRYKPIELAPRTLLIDQT